MALSNIAKTAGKLTGNPILTTAGEIASMFGFNSRHVRRRGKKKGNMLRKMRKPKRGKSGMRGSKRGFNSRRRNAQSNYGGPVVETMDAPAAFARRGDLKPFFKVRASNVSDGCVIHTVEQLGPLTTSSTANTFQASSISNALNPTNTGLFPYAASTLVPGFEKFKLRKLTMHYVHFVGTGIAGSVYAWWNPDALATAPTTSSQLLNDSNSCQGAVYEDFALEVDLTGLTQDWQYIGTSSTDNRLNSAGFVNWSYENCPASTGLGNLYLEAVFELQGRKLPAQNEPVAVARKILCSKIPAPEKRDSLHALIDAMSDLVLDGKKEKEEDSEQKSIARMISRVRGTDGVTVNCAGVNTGSYSVDVPSKALPAFRSRA